MIGDIFIYPEYAHDLEKIMSSDKFFPVNIVGPTGCGKTYVVEQLAKKISRKIIRVNMTSETDEILLIGGYQILVENGASKTEFIYGPVVQAMIEGSILLLDEIDLATPQNLQCLMQVLENGEMYIKQKNEIIKAAKGFNLIATSNTKGRGDETGKYIATNIQNEAFLERFVLTFEVPYMNKETELELLLKHKSKLTKKDILILIDWAHQIRDSVKKNEDIDYEISTRRLIFILKTYDIFGDLKKSIDLCTNRFDSYHKETFMTLFDILNVSDSEEECEIFKEDLLKKMGEIIL